MLRLTLLLCLLMVAALRWIVVSAEALTTAEQSGAGFPKKHVTLEAVNTGFKASPVAASIRAEDTAWIIHEVPSAAIDAGGYSTTTILSRSNRCVEFEFIEIGDSRMIEISLQPRIGPYRPRRIYLNLA